MEGCICTYMHMHTYLAFLNTPQCQHSPEVELSIWRTLGSSPKVFFTTKHISDILSVCKTVITYIGVEHI